MADLAAWSAFLTAHGPWPLIAFALAFWIWNRQKRVDQMIEGYQSALLSNTQALTALETTIRERGRL